jgi:2-keto-3-deoxy-L-rhamnonate aldolase RhmA
LPHFGFRSVPASEALPALNEATLVMVQCESAASLEATEEIVAIEGIDMVMIGSNDLLADLGLAGQYDHPMLSQAYERVIAACRRRGKHVGVGGLATRPDLVAKFVQLGARYVSTGTDLAFLAAECARRARQVKELKL